MNPDRWQRVHDLFLSVCDLEDAQRHRALALADREVREQVVSLLHSQRSAPDDLLEPSPLSPAEVVEDPWLGCRVGPYRLTSVIGLGGMGAVYRAERVDEQYEKTVAVKLIRPDLLDAGGIRRFRTERQALARLDHPNIARLLDGGVTARGVPYLVMEWVDGQQICANADDRRLDTRRRLRLFRDVCRAVQFAHQNLVVHCDLKPSNILVDRTGAAKLLDFGLARLLEPIPGRPPGLDTATGRRFLTLEYASPEHIRGDELGVATDVYSLGVVLYELLCGRRPFCRGAGGSSEFEARVLGTEPQSPSAAVWRRDDPAATAAAVSAVRDGTPRRLSRRLRGDLDNIVLKAMRKEPHRRYASVQELADDLDNALANRPVSARRDSVSYRAARFARRHRVGVAATAISLAALAAGVLLTGLEARRATRERDRAAASIEFLVDVLSSADPQYSGGETPIRTVLERASHRVDRELRDQPDVRVYVQHAIGACLLGLGLYDEAEQHLRAVLAQRQAAASSAGDLVETANTLSHALYEKQSFDQAETLLRDTLPFCVEVLGTDHALTAQTRNNLAAVLCKLGELDEAEELFGAALAARRRHRDPLGVAETLNNLAGIARRRGDLGTAERLAREALQARRSCLDERHPLVIQSTVSLATFLHLDGRLEAAEPLYRESLAATRDVLGADHPDLTYVARNLANLLMASSRHDEAAPLLRQSLEICNARLPKGDTRTVNVALCLGECCEALGERDEAERLLLGAHADIARALGADHRWARRAAEALVRLYETGARDAAAAAWRRRLEKKP